MVSVKWAPAYNNNQNDAGKTARSKRALVVTELFNVEANDFDADIYLLVVTECSLYPNSLEAGARNRNRVNPENGGMLTNLTTVTLLRRGLLRKHAILLNKR